MAEKIKTFQKFKANSLNVKKLRLFFQQWFEIMEPMDPIEAMDMLQ